MARLAVSHCPGAPTGWDGYNHIARSHSNKARISTTKQHLGNYFAYVKLESVPDVPINHASTQTHFGTDEQRMSKTHKCGGRPLGHLFGQYAMEKKTAYYQNRGSVDCGIAAVPALSFQA